MYFTGCLLSIPNGVAYSQALGPEILIITYMCNKGYRFKKSGTRPILLGCTNGIMPVKPEPCERELSNIIY